MEKFIESDPRQPLLLPVDLREWVPEDDLAHFVLAAVERVPMSRFRVNGRSSGKAQYHPRTMLALLIYSYANGVFGSRRIERATYRDLGTRFICADVHPDHDTICKFRRENFEAVSSGFLEVLLLAKELKLLKVGIVSVDGTKMDANASKRRSVRYDRAKALREKLQCDIAELLEQAEAADNSSMADDQALPRELARREALEEKLDEARARLEAEAKARAAREQAEYERKLEQRESRGGKGPKPKPPSDVPRDSEQTNLTDPDSRLMRKNKHAEFRQAYNAQAAVDAEGSQLVVEMQITQSASDANELAATVGAIPPELGKPQLALADAGYANESQVNALREQGILSLVALGGESRQRPYDFRPPKAPSAARTPKKPPPAWRVRMQELLDLPEGRALYKLRQRTVEPVFGILREVMQFRRFKLRGMEKVGGEWLLVGLAYNVKRLHRLMATSGA